MNIFLTNIWFNYGDKCGTHFNKHIHAYAGKWIKNEVQTDPKLIWPVFFKLFIDDGFGITKGKQEDVIFWIEKFSGLGKTIQVD